MTTYHVVGLEFLVLVALIGLLLRMREYWFFWLRVAFVGVFFSTAWRFRPPAYDKFVREVLRRRPIPWALIEDRLESWIVPLGCAIGVVAVLLVLLMAYHRLLVPRVEAFRLRFLTKQMGGGAASALKRRSVDLSVALKNAGQRAGVYFIGLDAQKNAANIESFADLTMHVQVVGPSGQGKTASVIVPLALQALMKRQPCILVDGKGDTGLPEILTALGRQYAPGTSIRVFTPLSPNASWTYNPLLSSNDPNELVDLLTVALNLDVPGPGRVHSDTQRAFLLRVFNLFVAMGEPFNFDDLLTFMNYSEVRDYVLSRASLVDGDDMRRFLERLRPNYPELLGLATLIDKLFVADRQMAPLLNAYVSDINIKDAIYGPGLTLFSFNAGKKSETNEALAKMVLADIANAVGDRYLAPRERRCPAVVILDEFGQFAPPSFDKFISSAREAQVACVLSHQSNAQLQDASGVDRLAQIVRENTATKIVFRQAEEADFWARCFGTTTTLKRTDQVEKGRFYTERVASMGTIREVEEFAIHPNMLRALGVGQAVFKSKNGTARAVNLGWFKDGVVSERLEDRALRKANGLCLRSKIVREPAVRSRGGKPNRSADFHPAPEPKKDDRSSDGISRNSSGGPQRLSGSID